MPTSQTRDPVAPACRRYFIVMNAMSGSEDARERSAIIERVFDEIGDRWPVEATIMLVESPGTLEEVAARAVRSAVAEEGAVVAAGGDGTLRTVAQAALGKDCLFGVLPQGTFNFFGREHDIPIDTEAAVRHLLSAQAAEVQVGLVNERVFLVNASLGMYPRLLEDREAFKHEFGRNRLVALWAGFVTLLRGHADLRVLVEENGRKHEVRTPTLFIGNNALQLENIGIPEASELSHGLLAALMVRPVGTARLIWLALRGAIGRLGEAQDVVRFVFNEITVHAWSRGQRKVKVATDGEICRMDTPLRFRVSPRPLKLLKMPST